MNKNCKEIWEELNEFITSNPEQAHISHNNLTYNRIINNIQDYLPFIYKGLIESARAYRYKSYT